MTSCSGSLATTPTKGELVAIQAAPRHTHLTPSAAPSLQRFSRGQVLYLQHCADCHGWEGRGDGPLAAVLTNKPPVLRQEIGIFAHHSDAQIVARILSGIPLKTVELGGTALYRDDEISAVLTYLQLFPTRPWEEVKRGKAVYDSLCAACHGLYGRGDGLGAKSFAVPLPDLAQVKFQQQVSDESLAYSITNGKGRMPGAGDVLTAHEIRAVITFLRILSPGHELYTRFCAYCHGGDGIPVAQSEQSKNAVATPQPQRFDDDYFRTHTDQQIRPAILHMHRRPRPTMPHLARQLSADEALEIVQHLRSLTTSP